MATQTAKKHVSSWEEVVTTFKEIQRRVRERLMQGEPLERVLESVVEMIQSSSPDMIGSVLLMDARCGCLRYACAPCLPSDFVKLLERVPVDPDAGPSGAAAFFGRRVIVENMEEETQWETMRDQALANNLKACWCEPIIASVTGEVLGTFALYYTEPKKPSKAEITLLEIAADVAGTAIEWKKVLLERQHLEDELRKKNEVLDERIKARTQELEHQNYINRLITDNATAGMFMINEKGFCTFMNAAASQLTGYTLEELRQKPLHDIIHHMRPDGTPYPIEDCPIDRALPLNNEVREHEDVFIRKDGTFFPVTCSASPIQENGVPVGTIVEVRDITEEKLYEEEIKDSAERLRLILEALPQISWTAGRDGEMDYINGTWLEYTGMPKEDALGNAWIRSVHPDDRLRVIERWQESLVKGIDYEVDFRIRHHDGSYRWFLVRALPLIAHDGEIVKWFGTCTDTHDQVTAIESLAQAQEQLKAINEELSVANRELVVTNSDLDNFIYTASHDLRSPIVNLEGLLGVLREELGDRKPTEVDKLLDMMSGAISRFKKTIADLTEISKTQKNLEDSNEVVNLPELLEEVKQGIAKEIADAGATITTDLGGIESISFSRKNFRSILYNLISNSIKYRSPDRPAHVLVKAELVEEDCMRLQITDNGLGFSMTNADQLFAMFKRLHDHVDGSGVGLYIVKRIVENAGGTIAVESEVDKGTTFNICLPYQQLVPGVAN